jgi:hypothetical protein
MEALWIPKTDETPEVILDKTKDIFQISGRSLPEDSVEFYKPVFLWIQRYSEIARESTSLELRLEYVNTASSKIVQDLLLAFEKIKGTKIIWHYLEDDEDMKDMGHELSELVDIPFEYRIM